MPSFSRGNKAALALSVLFVLLAAPAHAGANCEETTMAPEALADSFDAALGLKAWLDERNPGVAIIARRGQNLDEYGLRYSHAGFALKNPQTGAWTVLHMLNACGSDRSNLFENGLAEFFGDSLYSTEVAVSIPAAPIQAELLKVLAPQTRFLMHNARYSAVAYPFALKYQNSNGWVLETFANAVGQGELTGREQAQAVLRQMNYVPDIMAVGTLKRLGARAGPTCSQNEAWSLRCWR
jgi:hypothetical protein